MPPFSAKNINKFLVKRGEVLDLSKDITILIQYKIGSHDDMIKFVINIANIDMSIKECEDKIKESKMMLDMIKNQHDFYEKLKEDKELHDYVVGVANVQIKLNEALIEQEKVRKMIFLAYINKKDLSILGSLYLSKVSTLFSLCLELTAELVEYGHIEESEYLDDCNGAKEGYNNLEEQLEVYNKRTDIVVTNIAFRFN